MSAFTDTEREKELQTRLKLGAGYKAKSDHVNALIHYSKCYELLQGEIDKEAYRVEQRGVGFSDNEKIGTDNIQQCVVVIIHDPITKKTALAHVDYVY